MANNDCCRKYVDGCINAEKFKERIFNPKLIGEIMNKDW
jgi:hypothetical protein